MFRKSLYPTETLAAFLFALALTPGCLESPGASTTVSAIPELTIECSSAQVQNPHCRGQVSESLWIGLTSDFNLDCSSILASFSSTSRDNYFVAISDNVTLTHSGFLSTATVSSWSTPTGASISTLSGGSYKACAFIEESSGNDRLNLNEPLGAAVIQVGGSSPQVVNDWISY